MSVLDRDALEQSPLADLHAIASELSIDGYRRLRKAELIEAILGTGGDGTGEAAAPQAEEEAAGARRRRGSRGGRGGRSRAAKPEADEEAPPEPPAPTPEPGEAEATPASAERRRGTRSGRRSGGDRASASEPVEREDEPVEGVVELLPNGSGFVRVSPPDPSDDDVYISAAQVKRCELVSGDRITGPRRAPRRSERFASLVRVDTINGNDASELASGTRFDDLPATFPTDRFRLGSDDPTLKAIEYLTPFGKGSRVTITGASRAGKSEALRRLAAALAAYTDIQVSVALAGVRPEELSEWSAVDPAPAAAVSFAASAEAQDHAVELVVDQARRIAARGADAVVLIDTLEQLHPAAARKALAAARNIVDGGSLTIIATATQPLGGETTVIALDVTLASTGRFPAVDLIASGTLRPALLVGDAGADAIADARAEALEGAAS